MKKAQQGLAVEHVKSDRSFTANDNANIQDPHKLRNSNKSAALDRANTAINYQSCNTCKHWRPEHYAHEFAPCTVLPGENFATKTRFDFECKRWEDRE